MSGKHVSERGSGFDSRLWRDPFMRFAVDLEGTLADVHHKFVDDYNETFGTDYTVNDIDVWDFCETPFDLETYLTHTERVWEDEWYNIPPTDYLNADFLNQMQARGDTIHIVTAREGVEEQMQDWLDMEMIPHDEFRVERDKHELGGYDRWVDDRPGLFRNLDEEEGIIYDRPYNQNVEGRRIGHFGELLDG